MLANSWLYHYYTVQSKIQFGMPLDSAMRVPPGSGASSSTGYYTTHQQTHGGVAGSIGLGAAGMSGVFGSHHGHHHHHHTTAAASYHHHHPHMGATYGGVYHAEGALELKEDQQQLFGFPTAGGLEPVDYSQVNGGGGGGGGGGSISASTGCSQKSTQSATPPPPKKRARNKLEPLYLHAERSPLAAITPEPDCYALHPSAVYATAPPGSAAGSSSDASTSVIYATIVPTRPRLLNKTLPPDPADFIEQWNPSPPWSESAQKASLDSFGSSHELSPCITTTPPTPTSATPQHVGLGAQTVGPAFSFEWMSDPLVPVAYQQWPPATGDHHQHLSQHLAAAQLQQQQQHQQQHQQHPQHLSTHHLQQHPHTQHAQSTLHGVHVARVELAAESMVGTGRPDATVEPVDDRG